MTLMKPIPGYTVPGLQLDRVGPEDADDTHEAHLWLHCTWSPA
jgi:hypothetical protein